MKVGFLEDLMGGGGGSGQSSKSDSDSESSSATDTAVGTSTQVLTTTQVSPIISPIISSPNSGFTATATQHTESPGGISPFGMGPGTSDIGGGGYRDIREIKSNEPFDIMNYTPDAATQYQKGFNWGPVYIIAGLVAAALVVPPLMNKQKRGARRAY